MGFYDEEWTDCYQISMLQEYRGQEVVNRFFFKSADPYVGSLDNLAIAFYGFWTAFVQPVQSTEQLYLTVRVRELFGTKQTFDGDVSGANGSQSGAELPAFFGARYTLTPGDTRVRKGRKIFSGILEEMVDIDSVAAGYVSDFSDLKEALDDAIVAESTDFTPVLLSMPNNRHAAKIITSVVSVSGPKWSTQNSRKLGRGS